MGLTVRQLNMMKITILTTLVVSATSQYASPDLSEPPLYAYQYGVNDDYSGANFAQDEQRDGYTTSGSYTVALPDGRTQHVSYHTDGDSGNIQDVTYDGVPTYGPAAVVAHAPVVHHAPLVAHAPVVHHAPLVSHTPLVAHHGVHAGYAGAGQVSHQSVSKPFQGEHRSTTQSKAFGAGIASVADSPNRLHGARGVLGHGLGHGVVFHG